MSTPLEQARAIASARRFLLDLCLPGKIKRVPRQVRLEARARVKHMPMSWDLPRIVEDEAALDHMQEIEEHYRKQFWEECGQHVHGVNTSASTCTQNPDCST